MAIIISDLPAVMRDTPFESFVTVEGDAEPIAEVIDSVLIEPIDKDDGVLVDSELLKIDGSYTSTFIDELTFVSKGSSNKIEEPTIVVGAGNMPEGKELYSFKQDTREFVLKEYKVTVIYDTTMEHTEVITQQVNNSSVAGVAFLTGYIARNL